MSEENQNTNIEPKPEEDKKQESSKVEDNNDYDAGSLSELTTVAQAKPIIPSRHFVENLDTVNIQVDDHIKHIKYTLPDMNPTPVKLRVYRGLENIMTEKIKQEFNTYNYFGVFDSFDDMYVPAYDEKGREIFTGKTDGKAAGMKSGTPMGRDGDGTVKTGTPAVRSLFNRAGQVLVGNLSKVAYSDSKKLFFWKSLRNDASEWRVALNVPLMDSPATRKRIREHSGCSVKELVKASKAGDLGRAKYSYADFMYCKYLGRVSNNYLITLRRFPIPPGDCITTSGTGKTRSSGRRGTRKAEGESQATEDMGCLVTWLGTPGNDMNNVLKYSVTMPFEEKEAGWEDIQVDGDSSQGFLPSIASAFNDSYRQQYCAGYGGTAFNSWAGKFFGGQASGYDAKSFANFRDKNKIYGPVDVVKKIYKRSENGGLDFKQNITIVFDYELRSYNGINPRQAMLDLISNILNVTYTSGGWWGGGYKGGGMAQSSIFTNLNIFKFDGTFTGFCDSLQKDYQTLTANLASQVQSAGGVLQYCLKLLNNIGGMLMGGLLNKMGRPARAMMHSLLSEQPVGFWHLMVGNPHHPIMSVGNMILKNTTIEHYGPLGLDDFPTGLKVTCELDRGKPRDNREVEKMYMNGNDRIYSSIGPKVTDMYQKAAQYKAEIIKESKAGDMGANDSEFYKDKSFISLQGTKTELEEEKQQIMDDIKNSQDQITTLQKEYDEILNSINNKSDNFVQDSPLFNKSGGIIKKCKTEEDADKEYKEWLSFLQKNPNIAKPVIKLFSYEDENGKIKYLVGVAPTEPTDDEKKLGAESIVYSLDWEDIDIKIDGVSGGCKAIVAADNVLRNLAYGQSLEIAYSQRISAEAAINKLNSDYDATGVPEDFLQLDRINQNIEFLQKYIKEKGDQYKQNFDNRRNNDELIYISNRLQEMTANLDSWNGDELWRKFKDEEQIQILSKLADTDWYNLLYNWFGQADLYSISLAAQEIEYGSYKKKDTELKTYDPNKVETSQASTTMLKNSFDRHDWSDGAMDVSVNHVDGDGNIHKLYIQVDEKEQNGFLEAYKKYLDSGDLSDISKYVDNKVEKEKSFTSIDGKVQDLDISKAVAIKPKDPPTSPALSNDADPNNPGGNGDTVPAGDGAKVSNASFYPTGAEQPWGIKSYGSGQFSSKSIDYEPLENHVTSKAWAKKNLTAGNKEKFWQYRHKYWNKGTPNKSFDANRAKMIVDEGKKVLNWNDLQAAGFTALMIHESRLKTNAKSHTGAWGLGQWIGQRKKNAEKFIGADVDNFAKHVAFAISEIKDNVIPLKKHYSTSDVGNDIRRAVELCQGFFAFQAGYPTHQIGQSIQGYNGDWDVLHKNTENTVATAHYLLGVPYPTTQGWPGYGTKYLNS